MDQLTSPLTETDAVSELRDNVSKPFEQAYAMSKSVYTSSDCLARELEDVFKQILSVSTTFVSASVPVNAFNRAEVIDNVYLALFKADADGKAFPS